MRTRVTVPLNEYHRQVNRVHYACGHHADFKVGPPPRKGDWMICHRCMQETYVEYVAKNTKLPRRRLTEED